MAEGVVQTRGWRWLISAAVVGVLVLAPYGARLGWPSLYADDVVRIAQVRTWPLVEILRRPFNEHLAPVHGLITWAGWELCGGRLTAAPRVFTWASFLALPVALGALGWAVWRRTGLGGVAMGAVAVGGLSWLYLDVVANYSGSGFVWALAGALVAFGAAEPAGRWAWVALGASALAPACSAIGMLAGPLGAVGGWFGASPSSNERLRSRLRAAVGPLAGLGVYLTVAGFGQYGETVTRGLGRRVDLETGVLAAGRAVWNILPMAIVGAQPGWTWGLSWTDAVLAAGLVLGVGVIAWRTRQWGLAIGGLVLVAGGYGLTYPLRYEGSAEWLLRVDRYHLFPHFGFVLWLVMVVVALRGCMTDLLRFPSILRRSKSDGWNHYAPQTKPKRSLMPWWRPEWTGPLVAVVLLALHGRTMVERLRFYDFPEQTKVLSALERLQTVCGDEGITREQALAALESIRTSWLLPERNGTTALTMLGPTGVEVGRIDDGEVRGRLLARLSVEDCAALWGGMDVTRYVMSEDGRSDVIVEEGREASSVGMRALGANRYQGRGWPSYLEYVIESRLARDASGLWLRVRLSDGGRSKLPPVEVWWSDGVEGWSETRRVTWRPSDDGAGVVPLEAMPHWRAGTVQLVRIAVRPAGEVEIDAPRLVR